MVNIQKWIIIMTILHQLMLYKYENIYFIMNLLFFFILEIIVGQSIVRI